MRRGMPCRTFRGWHATRRVASIGQREVQIQADGRRAAWRAETMQIVCDFRPPTISVATRTLTSGARRNGRRPRDAGRSSVHVAAQTRTDACRLDGRHGPCAELAGRGSGGHRSHRPMKAGGGGSARGGGTPMPQCRFRPLGRLNVESFHPETKSRQIPRMTSKLVEYAAPKLAVAVRNCCPTRHRTLRVLSACCFVD
jgi:hypothetical protein